MKQMGISKCDARLGPGRMGARRGEEQQKRSDDDGSEGIYKTEYGRGKNERRGVSYLLPRFLLVACKVPTGIWSRLKRWSMEPSYDLLCLSRLVLMFTSRAAFNTRHGMDCIPQGKGICLSEW